MTVAISPILAELDKIGYKDIKEKHHCLSGAAASYGMYFDGAWAPYMCDLNPKMDDTNEMMNCFNKRGIRKIAIMGDSQGVHLRIRYMNKFGCYEVIRSAESCNGYFQLENQVHNECLGCSGCGNELRRCMNGVLLEYVGLEYAEDTKITTTHSNSSQQSVISEYFTRPGNAPDVFIFNAGLHDTDEYAAIENWQTYYYRLDTYIQLLYKHFPKSQKIFLLTTLPNYVRTPEAYKKVTTIAKVAQFNLAAEDLIKSKYPDIDIIYSQDIANFNNHELYTDGVHLHGRNGHYYDSMLKITLHSICGAHV